MERFLQMAPPKEPPFWRETLAEIQKMRAAVPAPVDTMGCHQLPDATADPKVMRYHALTSLMLSAQTKDQMTAAAMRNLKQHGLTVENILKTDVATIDSLIRMVGFHQRKAEYIKKVAEILHRDYDDDIPDSIEKLVALPGVGPKMAHLTMQVAWNKSEGIGVDVHVHRITNRLGWVKTKTPEETRKALEKWLPRELWAPINPLLVGFGQTICRPVGPLCDRCAAARHCPTAPRSLRLALSKGPAAGAAALLAEERAQGVQAAERDPLGEGDGAGTQTAAAPDEQSVVPVPDVPAAASRGQRAAKLRGLKRTAAAAAAAGAGSEAGAAQGRARKRVQADLPDLEDLGTGGT